MGSCIQYIFHSIKATTESCCSDGTFMTSHKAKTAIAPGEVIWLDMATSHTRSHTHKRTQWDSTLVVALRSNKVAEDTVREGEPREGKY